jgi:hypothetical protein
MGFVVGIDTADNKSFSCIVFGFENDINLAYRDMDSMLVGCGEKGPFHWKSMSKNTKKRVTNRLCDIVKSSNLKVTVFHHKKPEKISEKEFYLKIVPNEMAANLETLLKNKYGFASVECDDDFFIKGYGAERTVIFLSALLQRLTYRLGGEMVKIRKAKNAFMATIKQYPDKILHLRAAPTSRKDSKAVQIADLLLGLYRHNPQELENKIFFREM